MDTVDWIAISVFVYLLSAATVATYAFVLRRASVFEPIGQFLIFVSLFTLPLPVRTCFTLEIDGNVTPHLLSILPYLPAAVLCAAASIPLFAFGYFGTWAQRTAAALPLPDRPQRDNSLWSFAVMATCSLVLIYLLTESVGGLLPFLLLGYGSTEETFGRGYLAIGFPWLFVASLLLLHRYVLRRSGRGLLLFALVLAGVVGMQLLTGNRGMLVYIGLTTLIFINFGIRRLGWSFLAPFGIAAFLLLNLIGLLRQSNYESVEDFIERSSTSAEAATSKGEGHGLFYALTVGEFVVPIETLPQVIRTVGISDSPWFGLSYLRTPLYAIPSAVFPDRPLPLGNWYMQRFYGQGWGLNEGRAFFFLAEGYLNFLLAGVVLVALFWGWLWGSLHRWMLRSRGDPAVVLVYALAVGFMFRCIAGDFSTLVIGITQQSLVPAFIGLLIAGVRWKRRVSHA